MPRADGFRGCACRRRGTGSGFFERPQVPANLLTPITPWASAPRNFITETVVYNHKRHGHFKLSGGRSFDFHSLNT